MKNNYYIFVNAIVSKAKTFRHIKILYKLFNINKFNILNEENQAIIWELVSVFKNKILTEDYDLSEISKIISILVKLISNNNDFLNKLLEGMKINFSKNDLTQIITNILNKNIHEFSDNTIDVFLKAINLDDNNNLSNKTIILLLYKFKGNVRMEKHILEGIKNDIKEQDIFNIKFSESLELIMKLIDDGFFIGKYNEVNYIKKTIKFMNILKEKLENFIFSMEELKLMYQLNNNDKDGNNLSKRLRIISLGNKNVYNHLSELLIKSINYFHVIYENIKIIINIFSNYYPNEKEEIIKKYQEIIEYINVNPINKFPKNIENFEENCNLSKELYKLKNSKVFIIIYDLFKNRKSTDDNKSDSILINQVKNEFKNLKNLFYDGKDKEMDVQLLEDILKKLESNELKKEIVLLSNILNIKFDDLVMQKIQLLKKKESNIKILKKIILLLNDFEFKDNKIKIILEKSKEDLENISTLGKLIEIDKNLLELNLNILNSSKNEKSLEVINKMYEKPELMAFLKDKTINDIHQMGEFIDDSEEVFITIKDITYLEGCKKFTEDLEKYTENEEKFLNEFMNKVEKNKTIYLSFSNSSSKYHNFNELYSKYLNPNEMNKQHIKSIYQSSIFKLQLSNSSYECVVLYETNKKVEKDFEDILELREIALLRKKDQTEEIYFTICEKFANIVNEIQEILDILNNIASKGYFENLDYIIEIKEGESFGFKSNKNCNDIINKNNLKKIIDELNNIKDEQNNLVRDIYKHNPKTRLIYGKQFEFIYKKCLNKAVDNYDQNNINNIIKYITNNNNKNDSTKIKLPKEQNTLKQMYEISNDYLNSLFKINFLNYDNIFKNSIIKNKNKNGIYSYSCSLEEVENNAINCSLDLTGNFPMAQTLLYCSNETSEEEIMSFIYRSILCEKNVLFILIKPEALGIEKKNLLIQLLKELYLENNNYIHMKSCLLFIYTKENKTKDIIIEIEKLQNHHKYYNSTDTNRHKYEKFPDIEIYSSEFSGLGKSTLIENQFEISDKNYDYEYFPIGDKFNKEDIIQRLLSLSDRKVALHLDLSDSDDIELIREFMFRFLILKYYSVKENIFFYGKEMKIKIELPNSFINYLNIFPFLNFFKLNYLTHQKMPKLLFTKENEINIQIICNYLKYIDYINENDIIFEGLSQNKSPNSIKAKLLARGECEKLILENLIIIKLNHLLI